MEGPVEVFFFISMDRTEFEKVVEKAVAERGCSLVDIMFNDDDNVFEVIDYIVDYFGEGSIEARYVELVCKLGVDGKKHTNEICKELGCSRQNLTIIKRRIAAKLGDAYRTRLCA